MRMPQPFNYVQQVQSPVAAMLQGYQAGTAIQDRRRQMEMIQQQQAQNAQFREAFQSFSTNPNKSVTDYTQLLAMAPQEMVGNVKAMYEAMTEERQSVAKRQAAELISAFKMDPDRGKEILDTRIEAAKNAGNMEEVQALQAYRKIADVDPDAVVEAVALQSGMAFGDEFLKQIPGLSEKRVQGQKVLDDGTTVIVYTDGTTEVRNPAGVALEGEARAQAIRDAQQYGIDVQRERAGGRELAKISAKEGKLALDGARSAQGNIANLKEARRLVAEEGASTGVLQRFLPTFRDSTIALREIQRRLGLDVIGSVTFGALSEGELQLALDTALPTDLSGPALIQYLDRKIAAQDKVAREQQKLAEYLLRGGDLGTYLAESGAPSPAGGATRTADDILAELRASGSL
jgi:hypothetical protein